MLKYFNTFVKSSIDLFGNYTANIPSSASFLRSLVPDFFEKLQVSFSKLIGFSIILLSIFLTGCWTSAITGGASIIYDRHNIYLKLNDYQLASKINRELYKDKVFKCEQCALETAVFNRDVLITGSLPSKKMRQQALKCIQAVKGSRKIFNQVAVSLNVGDSLYDSWITGNIRGKILADADVDPHQFKVVTSRQIVYLLGDVRPEQAKKVLMFARQSPGVYRVVNLMRYYNYIRDNR